MPIIRSDGTTLLLSPTQTPSGPVRLDPNDPINHGLIDYLVINEGTIFPINLACPSAVSFVQGAVLPTSVMGRTGAGLYSGNGTGGNFSIPVHPPLQWCGSDFTIRILFKPVSYPTTWNTLIDHSQGGGAQRGLNIYLNTSGDLNYIAVKNGFTNTAATPLVLGCTAGGEYNLVMTWVASTTTATFYVDGISKGSINTTIGGATGVVANITQTTFGNDWSGTAGAHPNFAYFAYQAWGRILNTQEIAYVTANPYPGLLTSEPELPSLYLAVTGVSGTLGVTEATDVAAVNGSVIVSGPLTVTEAQDTASLNGSVTSAITGTFAPIEVRDTAAFSGSIANATTGTLAVKEAGVSLSNNSFSENSAVNTLVGSLSVIGIDTAAFSGSVTGIVGILAVTEVQDQAFFQSVMLAAITGTLVANESSILLSNNSFLENSVTGTVVGALSVIGVDTAAFNGSVGVSGTLTVTEVTDGAAFNGTLINVTTGQLAVTEATDGAIFNGAVFNVITGQLTVTEAIDGAAFAGALHNPPAGTFAAVEVSDIAALNGTVTGIPGVLTVTETQDFAVFNGVVGILGILTAIEAPDLAAFSGAADQIPTIGDLIVTEALDVAFFTGIVPEESGDSDFENWKFGYRFDRSLTCRFPWQSSFGSRLH